MKINWNFLEGGGEAQNKEPSVGVVWISGTAQCRIPHPTLLLHEKILHYTHRQEEEGGGMGFKTVHVPMVPATTRILHTNSSTYKLI